MCWLLWFRGEADFFLNRFMVSESYMTLLWVSIKTPPSPPSSTTFPALVIPLWLILHPHNILTSSSRLIFALPTSSRPSLNPRDIIATQPSPSRLTLSHPPDLSSAPLHSDNSFFVADWTSTIACSSGFHILHRQPLLLLPANLHQHLLLPHVDFSLVLLLLHLLLLLLLFSGLFCAGYMCLWFWDCCCLQDDLISSCDRCSL